MGINDTISGTVHQPNNKDLSHGRVDGFKEKSVNVSGLWEVLGYESAITLKQSGTNIEGTINNRYERGSLRGKLTGNVLVMNWKASWEDHEWHKTPEGFLNSGQTRCVLSKDGQTLDCVITKAKKDVGAHFTLRRKQSSQEVVLTFLLEKDNEFVPVPAEGVIYGEVFFLEAEFDSPPKDKPVEVELKWEGDSAPVELMRVGSEGLVYRSDPLRIIYEKEIQLIVERQVTP